MVTTKEKMWSSIAEKKERRFAINKRKRKRGAYIRRRLGRCALLLLGGVLLYLLGRITLLWGRVVALRGRRISLGRITLRRVVLLRGREERIKLYR